MDAASSLPEADTLSVVGALLAGGGGVSSPAPPGSSSSPDPPDSLGGVEAATSAEPGASLSVPAVSVDAGKFSGPGTSPASSPSMTGPPPSDWAATKISNNAFCASATSSAASKLDPVLWVGDPATLCPLSSSWCSSGLGARTRRFMSSRMPSAVRSSGRTSKPSSIGSRPSSAKPDPSASALSGATRGEPRTGRPMSSSRVRFVRSRGSSTRPCSSEVGVSAG